MIDNEGVSSTLEYVIIFGISFIVLTSSILVVSQMENRVIQSSSREKLEAIGNKIASKVTKTYLTHLSGEGYFKKELGVPSKINGENYLVRLDDDSVILEKDDIRVSTKLFNLNKSVNLRGEEISSEELFIIYDGENITLESSS
ncbi:hypothetical protein C9439_06230 [archaeon SCG-AAA382B04]|nr:hypothetical protein C9439_06230 [archaeon SCG-AAA382B04]